MQYRLRFGLLLVAVAACERPHRQTNPATVTVLYPGDERILGPHAEMPAKFLMFLPLVRYDSTGEFEGVLARHWDHSADYKTWTIHLRTDVTWHDGTPFTAHDVKFTLELFQHPEVLWESPSAYSASVLDDSTFTITDRTGCGVDPLNGWTVYYPEHLLEDLPPAEFTGWEFWTRPVGNGPYRYVRHVPKTMMELEANPDYYTGRPRVDRLVLKFGESSVVELVSGNVDVAGWVIPAEARRLAGEDRFRAYWTSEAPRAILWKVSHPLLRDAGVRRALAHAINRKELHRLLHMPEDLPVFDAPFSERQYRRGEIPEGLAYDPDLAGTLLSEAGWRDTDGDGVRDKANAPFRFELIVPTEVADAGVYVQDQLRRVGIRVDLLTLEIGLVRQRWRSGNFQALIAFVDESRLLRFFGEGSLLGYANPRVIEALRTLDCTVDPKRRDDVYRELMPIFQTEQPAMFLFPMAYWFVAERRIRGLESPYRADPLVNAQHLWVEEP